MRQHLFNTLKAGSGTPVLALNNYLNDYDLVVTQ